MSFLASPVVAQIVEDCEELKGDASPGLYIAYHNAGNANARERILNNYNKKLALDCPCWPGDEMANANLISSAFACKLSSDPVFTVYGSAADAEVSFLVVNDICIYSGSAVTGSAVDELASDSEQACRDGILALVLMDFGEIDCS